MRQALLGGLIAAVAVAALAWWLREGAEPSPARPAVVPATPNVAAGPAPEREAVPLPARARSEPAPMLEVAPGAKRVAPAEQPVSAEPEAPADAPVPVLDDLLRLAPADAPAPSGPQSVEWAGERKAEESVEAPRRRRLRLDYSRENLTEGVPIEAERRRTDVGVSVPVDEAERLRVKGGVRVDERQKTEAERDAETTPTVGIEVRF